MKVGDIIFVKKGMHQLVGRGVVTSEYEYDEERIDEYKNTRQVTWTHKGEWPHPGQAVMKTLTDITSYIDYVQQLNSLFKDESEEDLEEIEQNYPEYTKQDFLSEVYMPEEEYEKLTNILKMKKNIILQGAPGVGKTFAAKRLAFSIMGVKDIERYNEIVDVMEELIKFTLLTSDAAPYLVDRYSERKESAEQLNQRMNQSSI